LGPGSQHTSTRSRKDRKALSPERYREYMRNYMREYQHRKRERKKYNAYMRVINAKIRATAREIFCPKCETSFMRERYQRHPVCPNCECSF
jgi:hypothetical protein